MHEIFNSQPVSWSLNIVKDFPPQESRIEDYYIDYMDIWIIPGKLKSVLPLGVE